MTAAIASLIRQRFHAHWTTLSPSYRLVFAGVPTQTREVNGAPWVRLTVLPGEARQIGFSNTGRRKRVTGTVRVQVFVPVGEGDGLALSLADQVAECWELATVEGVIFRTTIVQRVGESDVWLEYEAVTPWEGDTLIPT